MAELESTNSLFAVEKIAHQYPHCWRCKEPVMFRATEQWFCSVDAIKEEAVKAIEDVQWIPGWGEERIKGMVRDRNDWCISRQRRWGVPIPIVYCKDCGKPVINDETIKAISELFRKEGSDAWYIKDASEFLPEGFKCDECGCTSFTKEQDILDVWFDSGVTHAAVMEQRPELKWPADLYLEGADQYRGWFQSSLLTAVACGKPAPYKAVCTHGWVVDGEGKKQSKSLGNVILPSEIIDQYGADILRIWVASSDYHADIRISKDILKQLSEAYRKIRNTARYILGNLDGFNPDTDRLSYNELFELDKWAYVRMNALNDKVRAGYDARRSAQTAMYDILSALTRLVAPILSFTAEEIWQYMPSSSSFNAESVFLNDMPEKFDINVSDEFVAKWDRIHAVRDDVNKALENARNSKIIGKSLEASVTLHCEGELNTFLNNVKADLPVAFIVSNVNIENDSNGEFKGDIDDLSISVAKASGEKCERCWVYSDTVGKSEKHPTLCARCASILD